MNSSIKAKLFSIIKILKNILLSLLLVLLVSVGVFVFFNYDAIIKFYKVFSYDAKSVESKIKEPYIFQPLEKISNFEGELNQNNKSILYNNTKYPLPVFIPTNKNLFYALVAIRVPEFGTRSVKDNAGERDSCGTYQQRVSEYMPGSDNQKTEIAKKILGDEYDDIFTNERVNFLKDQNAAAKGKAFAINYPQPMRDICQELANNHVRTGLFDKIQIARLAERGLKKDLEEFPLNEYTMGSFLSTLCASHSPLNCKVWEAKALKLLKEWYKSEVFKNHITEG